MKPASLEYDEKTDTLYLLFDDLEWDHQKNLDDRRAIDYAADDTVIGLELLSPTRGVDLSGLPYHEDVQRILEARGFRTLQPQ